MSTTTDNLHKAVWDWLATCPHIGDMFFNGGRAEDGNTVIIPSDAEIEKYIDGSTKRNYNAALTRFLPYSTDPNDLANITALVNFDKIGEWVDTQIDENNLPALPSGYKVTDIEVLPNSGGYVTAISMTQMKYMLQFRIEYIRERRT